MPNPEPFRPTAVVDSTVWISALHFGGTPLQALEAASRLYRIKTCAAIRTEVERKLSQTFGWTLTTVRSSMDFYLNGPDVVTRGTVSGICRDPYDDVILECAQIAGARLLLSSDKDLRVLKTFGSTHIRGPRELLDSLGLSS